jgi:hypothetical protein
LFQEFVIRDERVNMPRKGIEINPYLFLQIQSARPWHAPCTSKITPPYSGVEGQMERDLQLSTNPVTDYELESIRLERILDGGRKRPADAPLPTGTSMGERRGGLEEDSDAEPSGPRRKPLN